MGPDGAWSVLTTASTRGGLPSDEVRSIAFDAAGGVWFGTAAGAAHRDAGGTWRTLDVAAGLPSQLVNAFAVARGGDLWIATAGGLARLHPDRPGPRCGAALAVWPDQAITLGIEPNTSQLFAVNLPATHDHFEAHVPDPDDAFSLLAFRGCDAASGEPSGVVAEGWRDRGTRRLTAPARGVAEVLFVQVARRDGLRAGRYRLHLGIGRVTACLTCGGRRGFLPWLGAAASSGR